MRFVDRSNGPALDELDHLVIILSGVDLDAHLSGDVGLGSGFTNPARLPDIVRQGFLTIDVFPTLQGEHGGEGVRVLARAHHDSVKLIDVVEELAEICAFARFGMFYCLSIEVALVDVAEGDDILGSDGLEVAFAAATGADNGNVKLIIQVLTAEECWGGPQCASGGEQRASELAAGERMGFHCPASIKSKRRLNSAGVSPLSSIVAQPS